MAPLLNVAGLQKRYGAIVVADNVTFALERGHCLGVIGPNGAGKSSLFGLISGTVFPSAGKVEFKGRDVTAQPAHVRARLGIVRAFQIPQPFRQLTVFENVLAAASFGAGLSGSTLDAWAAEVLTITGLIDKWSTLAGKLTLLDRKRLELAKAMASKAELLLLDEIAGGLTEREVEQMGELIISLKREHAVVWIEHIPHALRSVADRILVLHFGKVLLDGDPHEVMQSRVMREIYMGIAEDETPGG